MNEEIIIKKSLPKISISLIVCFAAIMIILIIQSLLLLGENFLFAGIGILIFGYFLLRFKLYFPYRVADILINHQGIKTKFIQMDNIIFIPWGNIQDVYASVFLRQYGLTLSLKDDMNIQLNHKKHNKYPMVINAFASIIKSVHIFQRSTFSKKSDLSLGNYYIKQPYEIAKIIKTELQRYREKDTNKEANANR